MHESSLFISKPTGTFLFCKPGLEMERRREDERRLNKGWCKNKKGRDLSYDRAHGCRLCRRSDLFFLFLTACSHGLCLPGLCPFSLFLARQIPKTSQLNGNQENLSREYVQGFQLPGLLLFFCWKLGPLVILVSSLLSSRPFQESIRL